MIGSITINIDAYITAATATIVDIIFIYRSVIIINLVILVIFVIVIAITVNKISTLYFGIQL